MLISAQKKNLTVLLVGLSASNNFGYEYKRDFDEMYVKLKDEFKVFYYPNFFKALISDEQENLFKYMQADSIHPNEQGVDLIVADFSFIMIEFLRNIM
jgi:acyl-CoA thioesterase-1